MSTPQLSTAPLHPFRVSMRELESFLRRQPPELEAFYRWRIDPARVIALLALERNLSQQRLAPRHRVGILSGCLQEPELAYLPLDPHCRIDDLKFPEEPRWDLRNTWTPESHGDVLGTYDTVICCQVLEHMPTPAHGFAQLIKLLAPGGLLVVNVPALNGNHGDPDYWYGGFHPRWLQYQAELHQLQILDVGGWGSCRTAINYALCDWASWGVLGPLHRSHLRHPRRLWSWIRHRIKYGPILSALSPMAEPGPGLDRQYTISWLTAVVP